MTWNERNINFHCNFIDGHQKSSISNWYREWYFFPFIHSFICITLSADKFHSIFMICLWLFQLLLFAVNNVSSHWCKTERWEIIFSVIIKMKLERNLSLCSLFLMCWHFYIFFTEPGVNFEILDRLRKSKKLNKMLIAYT